MANFRPIIINLLLVSLFTIALITAGIMVAVQNNSVQNIGNDTALAGLKDSLVEDIEDNYGTTSEASNSFENSSISLTAGIPFIDSIYGVWKVLKSTPTTMYNLIVGVIFERLLGDATTQIIISVIATILMITIIFAVVKLISTGDGG